MKAPIRILLPVAAGLALLAFACSTGDPTGAGSGNVTLLLTDAPIDFTGVSAVNVTLSSFTVSPADDGDGNGGEQPMATPQENGEEPVTLNLLDFQDGEVTVIALGDVPAGNYHKVRMLIEAAELVRDDDDDPDTPEITESIRVPSDKVDIPVPFSVGAGEEVEITLDFDAELSVQVNETPGSYPYILRPVLTPVGVSKR